MKLKEKLVNLVLSKQLNDLGVKKESDYYWVVDRYNKFFISNTMLEISGNAPDLEQHEYREWYHAYDVAELFTLLPVETILEKQINNLWLSKYYKVSSDSFGGDNAANSLARMLIYLKEYNLKSI